MFTKLSKEGLAPDQPPILEDPYSCISRKSFWKIISDKGIRYSKTVKISYCPLHDHGPAWEMEVQTITNKRHRANTSSESESQSEHESDSGSESGEDVGQFFESPEECVADKNICVR